MPASDESLMKGAIWTSMSFERGQGLLMVHGPQFSTLFCFCFNFPLRLKEFLIKVKNSSFMPLKRSDSLNAFVFDPKLSVGCVPAFALLTWWCLHILHILHPEHNQKISIKPPFTWYPQKLGNRSSFLSTTSFSAKSSWILQPFYGIPVYKLPPTH